MSVARFKPMHAVANNAPAIINVLADDYSCGSQRTFNGAGAPSASTLKPGNGKYQAANSGVLSGAAVSAPGINFAPGTILTSADGAGSKCQIVVDNVTAAGGITDWHFNKLAGGMGNYTTLPSQTNAMTVLSGPGSGAIFLLYPPIPDFYVDNNANVLYICTQAGTAASSKWTQATSSGGGPIDEYDNTKAYPAGAIVVVTNTQLIGPVTVNPGTYGSRLAVPANASGNQVPQFPYPTGIISWKIMALGINQANICAAGGNSTILINSSGAVL